MSTDDRWGPAATVEYPEGRGNYTPVEPPAGRRGPGGRFTAAAAAAEPPQPGTTTPISPPGSEPKVEPDDEEVEQADRDASRTAMIVAGGAIVAATAGALGAATLGAPVVVGAAAGAAVGAVGTAVARGRNRPGRRERRRQRWMEATLLGAAGATRRQPRVAGGRMPKAPAVARGRAGRTLTGMKSGPVPKPRGAGPGRPATGGRGGAHKAGPGPSGRTRAGRGATGGGKGLGLGKLGKSGLSGRKGKGLGLGKLGGGGKGKAGAGLGKLGGSRKGKAGAGLGKLGGSRKGKGLAPAGRTGRGGTGPSAATKLGKGRARPVDPVHAGGNGRGRAGRRRDDAGPDVLQPVKPMGDRKWRKHRRTQLRQQKLTRRMQRRQQRWERRDERTARMRAGTGVAARDLARGLMVLGVSAAVLPGRAARTVGLNARVGATLAGHWWRSTPMRRRALARYSRLRRRYLRRLVTFGRRLRRHRPKAWRIWRAMGGKQLAVWLAAQLAIRAVLLGRGLDRMGQRMRGRPAPTSTAAAVWADLSDGSNPLRIVPDPTRDIDGDAYDTTVDSDTPRTTREEASDMPTIVPDRTSAGVAPHPDVMYVVEVHSRSIGGYMMGSVAENVQLFRSFPTLALHQAYDYERVADMCLRSPVHPTIAEYFKSVAGDERAKAAYLYDLLPQYNIHNAEDIMRNFRPRPRERLANYGVFRPDDHPVHGLHPRLAATIEVHSAYIGSYDMGSIPDLVSFLTSLPMLARAQAFDYRALGHAMVDDMPIAVAVASYVASVADAEIRKADHLETLYRNYGIANGHDVARHYNPRPNEHLTNSPY